MRTTERMTISLSPPRAKQLRDLADREHGGKVSRAVAALIDGVTKSGAESPEQATRKDLT